MVIFEDDIKSYKIDSELNFIIQSIATSVYDNDPNKIFTYCGRLMQKLKNYEITEIE